MINIDYQFDCHCITNNKYIQCDGGFISKYQRIHSFDISEYNDIIILLVVFNQKCISYKMDIVSYVSGG